MRFYDIDKSMFVVNVAKKDVPKDVNDINVFAKDVPDTLYECARKSMQTSEQTSEPNVKERLSNDANDGQIWNTIR